MNTKKHYYTEQCHGKAEGKDINNKFLMKQPKMSQSHSQSSSVPRTEQICLVRRRRHCYIATFGGKYSHGNHILKHHQILYEIINISNICKVTYSNTK